MYINWEGLFSEILKMIAIAILVIGGTVSLLFIVAYIFAVVFKLMGVGE